MDRDKRLQHRLPLQYLNTRWDLVQTECHGEERD